ncbi:hypothetical protein [Pedobacter sp. V48]|uniref:hypothetical protein n=1 Tax=Pedobacter sp. V48 TaxID=509635 RepID=UPI0003E49DD2|nr:hypothetical protein [Pedobacter sp. V48]ETZ23374.1 hypothetical protein N824_18095 [Pedobacter sp. V48]
MLWSYLTLMVEGIHVKMSVQKTVERIASEEQLDTNKGVAPHDNNKLMEICQRKRFTSEVVVSERNTWRYIIESSG